MIFNKYILFLLFPILVLFGCNSGRDVIQFSDSTESVSDSLRAMKSLMIEISKTKSGYSKYGFDSHGFLYINDRKPIDVFSLSESVDKIFKTEKYCQLEKRMVILALFLNSNYISGGYMDKTWGDYLFEYRPTKENSYYNLRYLVLCSDIDIEMPKNPKERFVLLDRVGEISLVQPVELSE